MAKNNSMDAKMDRMIVLLTRIIELRGGKSTFSHVSLFTFEF